MPLPQERSIMPALRPPSFPSVNMHPASRLTAYDITLPANKTLSNDRNKTSCQDFVVDRRTTAEGNVLCIDDTQFFWLQRKLRTTLSNGTIRAGYYLKPPLKRKIDANTKNIWEVMTGESVGSEDVNDPLVAMVAIRIEENKQFVDSSELAALSYIASTSSNIHENIQNSILLAADSSHTYLVMPYEDVMSMSLFDLCQTQPNSTLPESTVQMLAKQILKGLVSLQDMKLCHQNLTLDTVKVKLDKTANAKSIGSSSIDYVCIIQQFEHAVRVPCSADGTKAHMITCDTPMLGRCNIQYLAPEVWNGVGDDGINNNHHVMQRPYDGYAVDLWAVGVMILSMLFGADSIFVAPVPEDRIFQQICIHGNLKEFARNYQKQRNAPNIDEDAIDLLQKLLHCDPKDRPTLAEVLTHPWIQTD